MRRILALIALVVGTTSAFSLSFNDVAARVDAVDAVRTAEYRVELAEQAHRQASYPGDYALSVSPVGSLGADETGVRSVTASASASLNLPLGLTTDAELRADRASDALASARRAAADTRTSAYARLYRLYQVAWLAQEELDLLGAELELARLNHEIAQAKFESGSLTLNQLTITSEALYRAQTARDQGTLAQRLTWLELALEVGLDPEEQPLLEPILEFTADPPKPLELSEWAFAHDNSIIDQRELIDALTRQAQIVASTISLSSARVQLSLLNHGLSSTYQFAAPSLSTTYSSPPITLFSSGQAAVASNQVPFSLSLSASVAVGGERAEELARGAIKLEVEHERAVLDSMYEQLDYAIRSAYQQMHRATDAVAQAERALEAALANEQIVATRAELGQAGEIDLRDADVAVQRAEFSLTASRIARENAVMGVAVAASYFHEHYPDLTGIEGE